MSSFPTGCGGRSRRLERNGHTLAETIDHGASFASLLAGLAGNPEDLETLDVYCATGSLRRAADLLHLHHSSVARRLEQLGKALDIELTEPTGLTRARLALTTWRLLND